VWALIPEKFSRSFIENTFSPSSIAVLKKTKYQTIFFLINKQFGRFVYLPFNMIKDNL
jgi:hypothetical protein